MAEEPKLESEVVKVSDDNYIQGVQCHEAGQYVEAITFYSKAIFLSPMEPILYAARAEAYASLGDLQSGICNYRKALTLPHDESENSRLLGRLSTLLDSLGQVYMAHRDHVEADMYFSEALHETPDNDALQLHRAYNFALQSKEKEMNECLSKCKSCQPMVDVLRCYVHIHHKKFSDGRQALERALGEDAMNPQVMELERYFDAEFDNFKMSAKNQVQTKLADSEFAEAASLEEATKSLTECISTFPHDPELYTLRASCYTASRAYALAVQDLFECVSRSGGYNAVAQGQLSRTLILIADELQSAAEYANAINYYTEALKWNDRLIDAYLGRGDCFRAMDRQEAALRDYTKVLELRPNYEVATFRLAALHNEWGTILYNQTKWPLACQEFSRAIDLNPNVCAYHYHRSRCRLMMKQPTFAVRDLVSCRDIGTEDPTILRLIQQFCAQSKKALTEPPVPRPVQQAQRPRHTLQTTPVDEMETLRKCGNRDAQGDYNLNDVRDMHKACGNNPLLPRFDQGGLWSAASLGVKVHDQCTYDPIKSLKEDLNQRPVQIVQKPLKLRRSSQERGPGQRESPALGFLMQVKKATLNTTSSKSQTLPPPSTKLVPKVKEKQDSVS